MIKIGIIGSQSMHAEAFARSCNIPDKDGRFLIPDCRITAICGIDDTVQHTKETADKGRISRIAEKPGDICGLCDAVMILTRSGENHVPYVLPFIKKGFPVFIDKPVCISDEDIAALKNEIESRECIIAGGSGIKHNKTLKELKAMLDSGELGEIKGISLNHNADIESPYNGIYFYACHAAEMTIELMGSEWRSVEVSVLDRSNFAAFVKYKNQFANLIFTVGYNDYFVNVYGTKKNISYRMDMSDIFDNTMLDFADRIRNRKITKSVDGLINNICLLRAMEQSIKQKYK